MFGDCFSIYLCNYITFILVYFAYTYIVAYDVQFTSKLVISQLARKGQITPNTSPGGTFAWGYLMITNPGSIFLQAQFTVWVTFGQVRECISTSGIVPLKFIHMFSLQGSLDLENRPMYEENRVGIKDITNLNIIFKPIQIMLSVKIQVSSKRLVIKRIKLPLTNDNLRTHLQKEHSTRKIWETEYIISRENIPTTVTVVTTEGVEMQKTVI